jgi:peptide/nickel transport system ATP-binding protein
MTPSLLHLPQGCAFRPRCPRATEICLRAPQPTELPAGKTVRCWHAQN